MRTSENISERANGVMRVQQFAQRLCISVWTARQWAYCGKITSVKVGKHLLIPSNEIDRLLMENTRHQTK